MKVSSTLVILLLKICVNIGKELYRNWTVKCLIFWGINKAESSSQCSLISCIFLVLVIIPVIFSPHFLELDIDISQCKGILYIKLNYIIFKYFFILPNDLLCLILKVCRYYNLLFFVESLPPLCIYIFYTTFHPSASLLLKVDIYADLEIQRNVILFGWRVVWNK